jgi:hypothetical protein
MIGTWIVATMLFATAPKDHVPLGCVDCHTRTPDGKDVRVSTLLKSPDPAVVARLKPALPKGMTLKGKHPPLAFPIKDVPASCAKCHTATSKIAPPMAPMVHAIHLTGEKNEYVKQFSGDCRHCHKLDATAVWRMPVGTEK